MKVYIERMAEGQADPIVINLGEVVHGLDDLGMSQEEVQRLIAWQMPIDERLLEGCRDDALIPIGDVLLGSFSWTSRQEVVCHELARIATDAPEEQLRLWLDLLHSYNYLAASKYRNLQRPADPASRHALKTAIAAFETEIEGHLVGSSDSLVRLGFRPLLAHVACAQAECFKASERWLLEDYRRVVLALESALTHYHAVVSGVEPPLTCTASSTLEMA